MDIKNFLSVKNIVGIVILITIISISLFFYNDFNKNKNKNIFVDQKKILVIIDSSKSMEKFNTKLINEINNLKNNPLNVFAVYSIITFSKQKLIDEWTKDIYPERVMINYFGTSQITNLLNIDKFDQKTLEASDIIIFTSKYDNDGDLIITDEIEQKITENKKIKIIKLEN